MLRALRKHADAQGKEFKNLLSELLSGKLTEDPFPEKLVSKLRQKLVEEMKRLYPEMNMMKMPGDREQPIQVRLLGAFYVRAEIPIGKGCRGFSMGSDTA
jgi:hypothetical protein